MLFRDLALERERELRRDLEQKLMDYNMVDMYADPAINDELTQRLPKARDRLSYNTPKTKS